MFCLLETLTCWCIKFHNWVAYSKWTIWHKGHILIRLVARLPDMLISKNSKEFFHRSLTLGYRELSMFCLKLIVLSICLKRSFCSLTVIRNLEKRLKWFICAMTMQNYFVALSEIFFFSLWNISAHTLTWLCWDVSGEGLIFSAWAIITNIIIIMLMAFIFCLHSIISYCSHPVDCLKTNNIFRRFQSVHR